MRCSLYVGAGKPRASNGKYYQPFEIIKSIRKRSERPIRRYFEGSGGVVAGNDNGGL
jgi:hypothetical protein